MPKVTTDAELLRNRTVRHREPPLPSKRMRTPVPRGRPRLISHQSMMLRRISAHRRSVAGVGGKMKHVKQFLRRDGNPRMDRKGYPYEKRTTAPRAWIVRKANRVRNKRARASRKVNR